MNSGIRQVNLFDGPLGPAQRALKQVHLTNSGIQKVKFPSATAQTALQTGSLDEFRNSEGEIPVRGHHRRRRRRRALPDAPDARLLPTQRKPTQLADSIVAYWVVVGSLAALMLIGLLSVAAWQFRFALASTVRVGSPVALTFVGLFSVRSLPTIIITWNPQPFPFERRHPMRSPTLEFWVRQPLATPLVLDF